MKKIQDIRNREKTRLETIHKNSFENQTLGQIDLSSEIGDLFDSEFTFEDMSFEFEDPPSVKIRKSSAIQMELQIEDQENARQKLQTGGDPGQKKFGRSRNPEDVDDDQIYEFDDETDLEFMEEY